MDHSELVRHAPEFNRLSNMAAMSNAAGTLSRANMTTEANSAVPVVVPAKNKRRDKETAGPEDRRINEKTAR